MNKMLRDIMASALVIFGGVVVFAKLQSYSWWLIGSWKGALGVVAVTGLLIALTNITELVKDDSASLFESLIWMIAAAATVVSLVLVTTRAEFIASSVLVGLAWGTQLVRHLWETNHHSPDQFIPAH
ncbi:MAG: hypothetical protein QFB87_01120 [Patescibacteria group bacterium]|nr:hypothetical protein [Patescibacteria group bacterium]